MELVISIVAKIAEYMVAPVGQWLCYSCHYNSNMENLRNQEKNLRDFKKRVLHSIDVASRKGEEIEDDVKTWLTKVDDILHQLATKILGGGEAEAGTRSSNAACLNLKHRHQLSREAKKIMENIAELLKNGNFSKVGFRPAAQEMVNPINRDYMSLDSRISIMERIMEALGDANINRIGVWGSAGVGKSTLMKEIFQKAKEESLFHEVALANVTDTPDVIRIQGEIAEMLDLELDPDKIVTVRAGRLRARLEKDNEKKILVILDDIWEQLNLEEIGITPSERCKVLLTSRVRQVLASEMVTEKNSFKLDILGEQEAWKLFEKMSGDSIKDDHDLQNEAIKVAKACEGLPIALVTVSRALKNHKNLGIWKDALVQLTRPTPKHDTEIWSPVYSCIELSYNHLVGEEVKSLFLLCARQGYYISYRDLLRYGFGLRLFDRIYTLEEARNRLETLVNNLRDSCLLLQSPHSSEEFYMHDVVRHVATIIASNDHNMFVMRGDGGQKAWPDVDALKICEALSIHGGDHIHKYPNKIECPNLRYFHVRCKNRYLATPSSTSFQGMDKLEDIFFQGMDKLEVLSLTNIQLSSLLSLRNLQTLCLDECKLGDIHGIGELKNLVILSLARSDISNLPTEIGLLTRLQLLDLSSCYELKVIPPNVLSSLVNLEELYMRKITVQWEVEGPSNEGKNASLAELKKLSNLITLEIDIPDANNLPKDLFTEKLKRYKICIGGTWHLIFKEELAFSGMLKLKLNMSFQLDFGIKMLLKRTEYLHLDESNITKSVLYQLDREDFQQLKHLCIENNGNIKHIPELRTSAFKNLKVLKVENCKKLRFIFSSSIARGLSLLEELDITKCNNVGAIFVKEEEDRIEDQGDMMLFRQLQTLVLKDLPKLVGFLSTRETNSEGNLHDFQLPLLHHQVPFPSLQTLRMKGLPKIKYVWSCGQEPKTVIRCLEHLQVLEIEDCGVEEIVAFERGGEAIAIRTLMFPKVTKLKFRNLPRLKGFYKGVHVSKWPMLKEMEIERCEKVEIFASEVVSFEKTVEDQRQSEMPIKQPLFLVNEHSFPSLETLEFSNMDSLEIIFGKLEGQNGKEPQVLISPASGTEESGATTHFVSTLSFPSLKKLHIRWMRKLEIIWQDQVTATSFPNIQELDIHNCDKLLHVFQSKLHTTTTLIESLTILNISYCSSLETVFGNMEGQNGKELQVLIAPSSGTEDGIAGHIEFPILTQLSLFELPKLKWIFEGVHTNLESWPSLKKLSLVECGEQVNKMIWASKFASSSSSQENQLPTCIQQPMFVVEEGTFPNLEYLSFCFRERTKCPSRFSDFPDPSSLLTGLPNLLNLNVYDSVWEEIFPYELVDREIRLRILRLCRLCMLTHLWKEDNTQPCPLFHNLEYLHVLRCGKLRNIVPSSVSLRNLTRLEISDCHGLINLLTSSTAKTLVQLERMTVIDCKRITEIVAMEDGEANVAITFNKLRCLELRGLPNLTHFCSGHYSFGFPSLDEVIVRCCPEMKTFSHGVLSTPKLKGVSDDYSWFSKRNLYWEDDLNTTTRCLWEESNQYDTRLLFRERVENSEEDEDHPSEDEDHSENFEEDEDHPSEDEDHSENSEEDEDHPSEDEDHFETTEEW
ncbi:hypothetical protein I3842_08G171100 [Carya illinoinensis]|uniref:AAA+ ATPase domain-containing protein n=1 Tax=Carya illinoinensis TaxID=32201 RepID=A0A922JEM1_CARIL|nr:hypothetical protein I3842_08G171100 [Carya illinoinensis]